METTSQPAYTEELVTDLDLMFVGGYTHQLTLHEGDTLWEDIEAIHIKVDSDPVEYITIHKAHLLWSSKRKRILKRLVTPPTGTGTAQSVLSTGNPSIQASVVPWGPGTHWQYRA